MISLTLFFPGNGMREAMTEAMPFEILEMERDFESKKQSIGYGDAIDELIEVALPDNIKQKIQKGELKLDTEGVDKGLSINKRNCLMCQSGFIREKLFSETCDLIFKSVRRVLDQSDFRIQTVVLVGGFAESKIVQDNISRQIKEKFPGVQVTVPTSPFHAVLKGAVLFGHDMMIFKSRIMKKTYGVATNMVFDSTIHEPSKKWKNKEDGRSYCKDIFDVHVSRGESVMLQNKQPSKSYNPLRTTQTTMVIPLYEYPERVLSNHDVIYTTDDRCTHIGNINVDIKGNKEGRKRTVIVTMIFGGTQLHVTSFDESTKVEKDAIIEFRHDTKGMPDQHGT